MTRATQDYKRSLNGSIGAGVKSIFESSKKYYILEHKNSSEYHKAGESQIIIIDQIEIGRSSKCQVRFDENFITVSRRHAAIIKENEGWKLKHLSLKNSTLLNGHKVNNEWYLQNGDEIQLSINGPKLIFIIPTGKKAFVDSIPLSRRMSLVVNQALRPFKAAIAIVVCLLLLIVGAGGYVIHNLHNTDEDIMAQTEENKKKTEELEKIAIEHSNAIKQANDNIAQITEDIATNEKIISEAVKNIENLKKRKPQVIKQIINKTISNAGVNNIAINKCLKHVFFIQTLGFELTDANGNTTKLNCGEPNVPSWSGTGFLLSDGRFVTARHVAEEWYYWNDGGEVNEDLLSLNMLANNGGQVVAIFGAISSSGEQFIFKSNQIQCNRSGDKEVTHTETGKRITVAFSSNNDYAFFRKGGSGLPYNSSKSDTLKRAQELTILGFPFGLGANSEKDIKPIYCNAIVAVDGLQNGMILTTDTNYEKGNSGGPVFITNENGELEVIGIVSAGAGRNTGFVVPISIIN